MDAKSVFIKQRSLFISGSKPQAFTAMLEDRKHDMDSTEDIHLRPESKLDESSTTKV
jgi:hypothetical protein